jgi:hypothetical protein
MGNLLERFQPRLSIFASALALNSLWRQIKCSLLGVPKKRRSTDDTKEIDAIVGRLREFLRLNYMGGQYLRVTDHCASYRRILDDVVLLNHRPGSCVRIFACGGSILDLLAFHHCNSVDSRSFSAQREGGRTNDCGWYPPKLSSFGDL